jgi:hypothetical protein
MIFQFLPMMTATITLPRPVFRTGGETHSRTMLLQFLLLVMMATRTVHRLVFRTGGKTDSRTMILQFLLLVMMATITVHRLVFRTGGKTDSRTMILQFLLLVMMATITVHRLVCLRHEHHVRMTLLMIRQSNHRVLEWNLLLSTCLRAGAEQRLRLVCHRAHKTKPAATAPAGTTPWKDWIKSPI